MQTPNVDFNLQQEPTPTENIGQETVQPEEVSTNQQTFFRIESSKSLLRPPESVSSHCHHQRNDSETKPKSLIGSAFRRSHSQEGKTNIVPTRLSDDALPLETRASLKFPIREHPSQIDEAEEEATWSDVGRACCVHSSSEWLQISGYLLALLFMLYFFLVGLDLLGTSFMVVGGCTAGSLLGSDTNPLASVMIGIIATAILQSSSTTTAVIVSLVSGGLDVNQGIYMVMGANVGTAITSMLVSLAHMGDGDELERAFAGSSVLYLFNFYTLVILLPIEMTTGYLYYLTKPMLPDTVKDGESWQGPIKKIVSPLVRTIIIANKDLIDDISTGAVESCSSPGIYPVKCTDGIEEEEYCYQVGVIACNAVTGKCPAFFQNGASKKDDMVSGWVCMIVAMTILILCLLGLVSILHKMLLGASTKIIYKATNIPPLAAILVGCGVTVLVQSSSITTSTLVPLAGIGVLSLEAMYPLVLGADIGTTFTALMAAMVSSKPEALQIALVHFFFNVTGGIIFYPVPFMRRVVLKSAELCGNATGEWKGFPIFFIVTMFICFPLVILAISSLFEEDSKGFRALGSLLVILILGATVYAAIWWRFRDGKAKFKARIELRSRRAAAIAALADDMDYLKVDMEWSKNEIGRIKDFAAQLKFAPVTMEEGRRSTLVVVAQEPRDDRTQGTMEDDERLSTYQSCRSKPWKDILYLGAGSIRSSIGGGSLAHV